MSAASAQASATTYASEADRISEINATLGAERLSVSPLARCIAPMMVALDWFGAPRRLLSSLPPAQDPVDILSLKRMCDDIGYRVQEFRWRDWLGRGNAGVATLQVGSTVIAGEKARVYLGRYNNADWWHDGASAKSDWSPSPDDTLLSVEKNTDHQSLAAPQSGWLNRLFLKARSELTGVLFVSLVINVLTLAISLFTMFVYNTVIPGGATSPLWAITAGVMIAIVGAWGLRLARMRVLSQLGAWAGIRIGDVALGKTLSLPLDVSARMGVENNVSRLRTLEGLKQGFGGTSGAVNVDFPFVIIFLFVIALLGGWIVVVPILGLLLLAAASWPLSKLLDERAGQAGRLSRKLGAMTTVITRRLRALRGVRGSALWDRHLSDLVAQSVAANRDNALANGLVQVVAQAMATLTVLATMGTGVTLVLAGNMSPGGLIATMMLIWRITTPAQQMFTSRLRLKRLGDAGAQLERLLASTGEASNPQVSSPITNLSPVIEADRLYYRYSADREPALNGVSFKADAGSVIAIVGPNGAGKTTLLDLLSGARAPQNGRVLVGGRDIRQFDPSDYRSWHGYLPQKVPGVPLTLPESIRLRRPSSTDQEILHALTRVAGPEWYRYFGVATSDQGLAVSISPWREDPAAVRGRYIVRMASAILGEPSLILLDDPLGNRDPALNAYFMQLLETLRGKSTIVMSTHRPDLIQKSDMLAVVDNGGLVHFGPVAPPETDPTTNPNE